MEKEYLFSENNLSPGKRKLTQNHSDENVKKTKTFSAKEFRKNLSTDNRLAGTFSL